MADIVKTNERDIEDANRIYVLFSGISEESKGMAIGYLSALRDKEIADKSRQLQEA